MCGVVCVKTVCVCERVFVYIHTSLCKCMQDYVQDYYVRLIVEVCKSHWVNRPCQCTRLCVVWCGVVWCGVVLCGVVWCGVVLCYLVWCCVVLCCVVMCGVVLCCVVLCLWVQAELQ